MAKKATKSEELWLEYMALSELERWPRNPRRHATKDLADSVHRFGYTDPLVIDERTGKLVAGHGRIDYLTWLRKNGKKAPKHIREDKNDWYVPVIRGNRFKNAKEAEAYLLSVNKITEKAEWDMDILSVMIPEVDPIGFDIVKETEQRIEDVVNQVTQEVDERVKLDPTGIQGNLVKPETGKDNPATPLTPDFDHIPGELQGVIQLDPDVRFMPDDGYKCSNKLGIPDLREDMLLQELPPNFSTWGDWQNTPDAPDKHWLYVFGHGKSKGLPYDRSVLAWFSHDGVIETLWNAPAYEVGKMLKANIIGACVPDFSLWEGHPQACHIYAVYRAAWIGRFFQESGIKVIPRFEYFLPTAREFSLLGIPKNPPVLATQLHTGFEDEHIPRIKESLKLGLDLLRPGQFLVYASDRGREVIESCDLPCDEVVILPTMKRAIRGKKIEKETDPYLLYLRTKKKGREGQNVRGGIK